MTYSIKIRYNKAFLAHGEDKAHSKHIYWPFYLLTHAVKCNVKVQKETTTNIEKIVTESEG